MIRIYKLLNKEEYIFISINKGTYKPRHICESITTMSNLL